MKPYYEDSLCTLWHGDCRDLLSVVAPVGSVSLVLTDPPYGIALNTDYSQFNDSAVGQRGYGHLRRSHAPLVGDDGEFDPAPLLDYGDVIIWGANNFASRVPQGTWLVWDKRADNGHALKSDAEIGWWSHGRMVRVFDHCWHGFARSSENSKHFHPTQKPVELMQWCIGLTKTVGVVADPYCGAGSTLVAAKNLNRRAIGIEIEERYCEIAAQRLTQEVLELGA